MAVTPFKFPPLFRKPQNVEILKRLGVRAVVVDSSNNFLLTLQDILNPGFELNVRKNASNKIIFQFFRVSYYCGRTICPFKIRIRRGFFSRFCENIFSSLLLLCFYQYIKGSPNFDVWVSPRDFCTNHIVGQSRLRGACASTQSHRNLRYSHTHTMEEDVGPDQN